MILDQFSEKSGTNKNLDMYFVERSLDNLKPGGTMALIVHSGVIQNKNNKEWRRMLLKKGNFLGAFRLPDEAFKHSNTSVNADVLIFRKHDDDTLEELKTLKQKNLFPLLHPLIALNQQTIDGYRHQIGV